MNKVMPFVIVVFLQACALRADMLEDAIQNNDLWQVKKYTQERSFTSAEKSYFMACAQKNALKAKPTMEPRFNLNDGARLLLGICMASFAIGGFAAVGGTLVDDISNARREQLRPDPFDDAADEKRQGPPGRSLLTEFFNRVIRPASAIPYVVIPIASTILLKSGLGILKKYFQGYYAHEPYIKALAIETLIKNIQAQD